MKCCICKSYLLSNLAHKYCNNCESKGLLIERAKKYNGCVICVQNGIPVISAYLSNPRPRCQNKEHHDKANMLGYNSYYPQKLF